MIQLLAPLLGSMLGPTLASSMGLSLSPLLASSLGSGIASLASGRDPKDALLSGLMTGGLGALTGGLGGGGADAGANVAGIPGGAKDLVAPMTGVPGADPAALATFGIPEPMTSMELPADKIISDGNLARQGGGMNGMNGILNWAREHPMMTAGALALPALLPNPAEFGEEESEDIPENFPTGPGPRAGYDRNQPVTGQEIDDDYWLRYGRPSAEDLPGGFSGEWQFFPENELQAPPAPGGDGGEGGGGGGYGSRFGGMVPDRWREILRRLAGEGQGYAEGGLVFGPGDGSGVDDMVQAIGPGNEPIRLSSGEYVMPARAVQNAGGPEAMDKLRARLLKAR